MKKKNRSERAKRNSLAGENCIDETSGIRQDRLRRMIYLDGTAPRARWVVRLLHDGFEKCRCQYHGQGKNDGSQDND